MNPNYRGILRPHAGVLSLLTRLSDGAIIWFSLHFLKQLFLTVESPLYNFAAFLAIICYLLSAQATSVFHSSRLQNYGDIFGKILLSWVLTCLVLVVGAFVSKTSVEFSRLTIFCWFLLTPTLLMCERLIIFLFLRHLRIRTKNTRSYVILGNSEATKFLPSKIQGLPWTGLEFLGRYDDLKNLLDDLKTRSIDYIFLCYSSHEQVKIVAAIKALNDSTSSIYLVPDLLLSDLLGSQWVMLGNTPLVVINDHPFYGGWWALKKMEDLILGTLILICIMPLMLVIGMLIKLNSPGPIFFKQRRHGLNGEIIKVFKFRTMTTLDDGNHIVQAKLNDARVTLVGKFLRRHSLDELPQFFNVLQGNMSIVGPRPHALAHNEYYRELIEGYMQRHKVKPGITGWAQVNGLRGETDTLDKMKARVEYDLFYINHWSISLDFKIILLTILNGVSGKAAH